jgi:hypothetical protein
MGKFTASPSDLGASATVTNITVDGDLTLDDGGSIKEAGGTAAITIDGSGHVTKIGQDSPGSGEFLKWDGSKAVWAAASGGSSATITVTDNESTAEENCITFVADAGTSSGAHGIEMDGDLTYNPSTGKVTATGFVAGSSVITDDSIVMTPSTDDTVTIAAGTNGTLTVTTVDTAAAAANVGFVVDGAFDIDAAGAVTIDGSAITIGGDSDVAIDIDASTLDIDASGAVTIDGASVVTTGATQEVVASTSFQVTSPDLIVTSTGASDPMLTLKNTGGSITAGPFLVFDLDGGAGTNSDTVGTIRFKSDDAA